MAEARFVCLVCGNVFPEGEARSKPVEPGEDQFGCPKCGSIQIEPYHLDPNEPVADPAERHEQQESDLE